MTAVAFHFNVPDRRDYACRLLRKALRAQARLVVSGEPHVLDDLDRQLWVFDALEFVPHWRGRDADALPARLGRTPLLLLDDPSPRRGHGVLVNLWPQVPDAHAQFDRVIEIVGQDESERVAARQRWRCYAAAGCPIERHEVAA